MQFKKEDVVAYLDADRSAQIEVELSEEHIVFLQKHAEELSEECGLVVGIGDVIGLILKAFIEEHSRQ